MFQVKYQLLRDAILHNLPFKSFKKPKLTAAAFVESVC